MDHSTNENKRLQAENAKLWTVYEAGKGVLRGRDQPHVFSSGQVFVDVGSTNALSKAIAAVEEQDDE